MAKVFGILLIVLGVWLGLEVMTKGMDGAFGGIFAQAGGAQPAEPPVQKMRSKVQESMKATAARTSRGIGDEPTDGDADMIDPSEVDPDSLDH
jgi:hypothetical protein